MKEQTQNPRVAFRVLRKLRFAAATVAVAVWGGSAFAAQDLLWDWRATDVSSTPVAGFIPAPFVSDANAASPAITSQLQAYQSSFNGKVSIKVSAVGAGTGLSQSTINSLFSNPNFNINYVFLDIENASPAISTANAQQQAAWIRSAAASAGKPVPRIGNYALFPGTGDNSGIGSGTTNAQYTSGGATGVNMANPDLYPGSPYYKDPAQVGGTSSSPNIRASLFTLPIKRDSFAASNLPAGSILVPYVNRFNNAGNADLVNGTTVVNGVSIPAFYADAAHGTAEQMLSRGDFKAMVAHYRLRGADGVHALDGGVAGYDQTAFDTDVKEGWSGIKNGNGQTPINTIFNAPDAKIATLNTTIKVNGVKKDFETAGVVFSGVYSDTTGLAGSLHKLALLVSNLTDSTATVGFPTAIGGKTVPDVSINGKEHKLLEYTASGSQWVLDSSVLNNGTTLLFTSAADNIRSGVVGIPEPVAVGGLSLFAIGALFRRSRRKA